PRPPPALGGGGGGGRHAPRIVLAFPHPNPPPQAGEGVHRVFVAHAIGPACSRPAPRISPPNESPSPSATCAAGLRRSRRKASSPKSTPRPTGTSSSAPPSASLQGPAPA